MISRHFLTNIHMLQVDSNLSNNFYNEPSLLTTASYDMKPVTGIHPRVCTLHKWSHYDGI